MAWQDRIQTCTYTSPSGSEFTLQYEDVSISGKKKTTAFDFIGTSDVYVQDNKLGIKTIPMVVYFSGDDHDTEANNFFAALSEQGPGKLQHPFYGLITVNPTGDIKRSDKLVTGANQSAFNVSFIETIENLYPISQTNQKFNAVSASGQFDNDASEEFGDAVLITTESEKQSFINSHTDLLGTFKTGLDSLANDQAEIQRNINDIYNSIINGIDLLVGEPLTLAFQTVQMIKSVSNSTSLIADKIDSYVNLLDSIISPDNTVSKTYDFVGGNLVQIQNIHASAAISAMNDAMTETDFKTRDEAIAAASVITEKFFAYMEWKERNFASVEIDDTGNGYQQLQNQTAISASFIIELSASLQRQRSVILDRDMFLIDFTYQYFGTTDNSAIEEVILLNGLDNGEIYTIPRLRLMKYYVV